MASTYLTRTQTAGNRRKGTFSAWVKRSALAYNYLMSWNSTTSGTSLGDWIRFNGDALDILKYTGSLPYRVQTNRLFRDTNAWYHIVVAYDSEQATASNRIKIYVNGVQETSFGTSSYPSENYDFEFNNNSIVACVGKNYNTEADFDGSMSHVHWCDGYAYDASAFGSTDTNGVWKINTSPSVTYGTNGFFILKDGNSVTDQSGNSNNFTVGGGTLTKTEDCPSNVFATVNALQAWYPTSTTPVLSNGNNTIRTGKGSSSSAGYFYYPSTLGMPSSGKWYFEVKPTETTGNCLIGIVGKQPISNSKGQEQADGYMYSKNGNKRNNNVQSSYGDTYDTNDIIGVAVDLDNNKIYFSKNGTYQNSGVPTSGSTGTGAAYTIGTSTTGDYFAFVGDTDYAEQSTFQFNFGNGYFGTTAVSSAGTNASGIGIFEYDTPTGYTALSTKGLNL